MRTFEEIHKDMDQALRINNAEAMRALAGELQALRTPMATASALHALGTVASLSRDYALALDLYRRAVTEYEALDERAWVASAYHNIGLVYNNAGDYAMALEYHRRSIDLFAELGNRVGVANAEVAIGQIYDSTCDYPSAMEHYHRALATYEDRGAREGIARITSSMATVYGDIGDYPAALEHFYRVLALYEELGNRTQVIATIGNIGTVYTATGDYSKALEQSHHSLELAIESGNTSFIAVITGSIGTLYMKIGDYPSSIEHHHRAIAIYQEQGKRAGVTLNTLNLIETLIRADMYDDVAELLEQLASVTIENPAMQISYATHLAKLSEHRADFDAANEHLIQALEIATEVGLRPAAAECHEFLRDLAKKRNDFEGYIKHNDAFLRITEEIRGKETTQKLAMMDADRSMEVERRERDKERALLYGTLPESVAKRMLLGEKVTGDHYDNASVIFLDIVGFTAISDKIPPGHVVHLLSQIFSALDAVCKQHGVTKIKTIGDSYMAVAGVPDELNDHAHRAASAASDMLATLDQLAITMPPELGATSWIKDMDEIQVRIGVHCGPVTAGVIGTERLQYDVWGDTVNVASRMESTCEPNRIHVSDAFATTLRATSDEAAMSDFDLALGTWHLALRGETSIKGKGLMKTFWLERAVS